MCTFFYKKRFIIKLGSNGQNLKRMLRKSQSSFSKVKCFSLPNIDITSLVYSKFKDRGQILVYKINKESSLHFSQFISVKVKTMLRKSQAQFREN